MLVFGDSITQYGYSINRGGYVARLANQFQRQMDVVNRGFSGYNTSGALRVVDTVLPRTKESTGRLFKFIRAAAKSTLWPIRDNNFPNDSSQLRLCVLFFGTNDAVIPPDNKANPLDNYYQDMHSLVAFLRNSDSEYYSPNTQIIIVTPPPVGELMLSSPTVANNRTSKYAQVAKKVASEAGVPCVDLFSEIQTRVQQDQASGNSTGKYGGYDKYLVDGIHLGSGGNQVIYELIMGVISSTWPEMIPEDPPS